MSAVDDIKLGETTIERELREETKENELDYVARLRLVVPDLRDTPYVPVPLKCKIATFATKHQAATTVILFIISASLILSLFLLKVIDWKAALVISIFVFTFDMFFGLFLSCGHHKVRLGKIEGTIHDVWICTRCGYIESGWGYVSYTGGGDFYTHQGYVDPNMPNRLKKEVSV